MAAFAPSVDLAGAFEAVEAGALPAVEAGLGAIVGMKGDECRVEGVKDDCGKNEDVTADYVVSRMFGSVFFRRVFVDRNKRITTTRDDTNINKAKS